MERGGLGLARRTSTCALPKREPSSVLSEVVPPRFNDPQGAVRQIRRHASSLGAIVLDPMPSCAGLIARTTDVHVVRASQRRHGVERVRPDPTQFMKTQFMKKGRWSSMAAMANYSHDDDEGKPDA
jgi:hypothetical protein